MLETLRSVVIKNIKYFYILYALALLEGIILTFVTYSLLDSPDPSFSVELLAMFLGGVVFGIIPLTICYYIGRYAYTTYDFENPVYTWVGSIFLSFNAVFVFWITFQICLSFYDPVQLSSGLFGLVLIIVLSVVLAFFLALVSCLLGIIPVAIGIGKKILDSKKV